MPQISQNSNGRGGRPDERQPTAAEALLDQVEDIIGEFESAIYTIDDLANQLLDLPESEAWLSDSADFCDLVGTARDRVIELRNALAAASLNKANKDRSTVGPGVVSDLAIAPAP